MTAAKFLAAERPGTQSLPKYDAKLLWRGRCEKIEVEIEKR